MEMDERIHDFDFNRTPSALRRNKEGLTDG
jgi:hypothetical protein